MPAPIHSHCHRCGSAYEHTESFPRTCPNPDCKAMTWVNPVPVAVVLVAVDAGDRTGLLVIRRGIEPRAGHLAIVGGFVDGGETWQAAGAREVREETGIEIAAADLEPFWYTSTEPNPNRVLLFSTGAGVGAATLPAFEATSETTERGAVFGPDGLDEVFAFSLHAEAARRWFAARNITGPHGFQAL